MNIVSGACVAIGTAGATDNQTNATRARQRAKPDVSTNDLKLRAWLGGKNLDMHLRKNDSFMNVQVRLLSVPSRVNV